jgi:uncharacterized tellurite resistance protein B-like protein
VSFAKILDRLTSRPAAVAQPSQYKQDPLRLATAAILLETAYADGTFTPAEGGSVSEFLGQKFALPPEDVKELLEMADEIRRHSVDHFALTHYVRKNSPLAERIEIVKTMWRLVYSDGTLNQHENYLVRKLADLLGLEHHVMIEAKSAVLREMER